jgi:hypothetical protein
MRKQRPLFFPTIVAIGIGALIASFALGCELAVQPDFTLIDSGASTGCSLCFDGSVIYDDDGNIELIPNDGAVPLDASDTNTTDSGAADAIAE